VLLAQVHVQLKGSAEHCNTDSCTLRHVALLTNYFSSFTLARRKELVLSWSRRCPLALECGHFNSILPPDSRQGAGAAGQSTAKCRCLVCTWRLNCRAKRKLQILCGCNMWL